MGWICIGEAASLAVQACADAREREKASRSRCGRQVPQGGAGFDYVTLAKAQMTFAANDNERFREHG